MSHAKGYVTKKAKVKLLLKKLYEEGYLDNETYVLAKRMAEEVKEDGDAQQVCTKKFGKVE